MISPEQMINLGFSLLSDVTAYDCLLLIRRGETLSRETISQFKGFNIEPFAEYLDADRAIEKLSERRPDIASVIVNHPNGVKWLQSQLDLIKEELMPTVLIRR